MLGFFVFIFSIVIAFSKPLNDMQTNGWILTRNYEHASI